MKPQERSKLIQTKHQSIGIEFEGERSTKYQFELRTDFIRETDQREPEQNDNVVTLCENLRFKGRKAHKRDERPATLKSSYRDSSGQKNAIGLTKRATQPKRHKLTAATIAIR